MGKPHGFCGLPVRIHGGRTGKLADSLTHGTRKRTVRNPSCARGPRENGSALAIMNPGSAIPTVLVNTGGSLRARYVDSDTGQVTITHVYAQ